MKSLNELIQSAIDAKVSSSDYLHKADHRRANAAIEGLGETYREIRAYGKEGETRLLNLLVHDNPYVRQWAAVGVLPFAFDKGLACLRALALDDSTRFAGSNANIVLTMIQQREFDYSGEDYPHWTKAGNTRHKEGP